MKKTLFLALLSVPLILTACAKNKAASATRTAVAATSRAVVEAPATLTGKTIVFNYSNAKEKSYTVIPGIGTKEDGNWHAVEEPFASIKVNGVNKKYTKVNSTTGKLIDEGNDEDRLGDYDYTLTFTSPTSGTAVREWEYSEGYRKAIGIIFTIK